MRVLSVGGGVMGNTVASDLTSIFTQLPTVFLYAFAVVLLLMTGFFAVKLYWRIRGNTQHTSYQYGVVAPVQYGDRGATPTPEAKFAERLDHLVEQEDAYDLAHLLPKTRELGAIANTGFRTAPVLDSSGVGILTLIEQVAAEVDRGFRVLMHTNLDSMVDLDGAGANSLSTKVSMTGVKLKFAVVDRFGKLVVAIDHQTKEKRGRQDFINRSIIIEVLRKAGVWYLEIPRNYSGADARAQLLAVLRSKASSQNGGIEVA